MLPYLKKSDRRRSLDQVDRILRRYTTSRERYEMVRYDPEAAAAFFEKAGFRVVKATDGAEGG